MTRHAWGAAGLLALSAGLAQAGALDRSGQPVTALFEDGNYAELSFGSIAPDAEGSILTPVGPASSGDVGADYTIFGAALKYDVTPSLSLALIIDNPFGADPDYNDADAAYPLLGSTAEFNSVGTTALARYRFGNGFSAHAGIRAVTVDALADIDAVAQVAPGVFAPVAYDGDFASDTGVGYVVGGAYERPEIALRVALTYSSAIEMSHDTDFSGTLGEGTGLTEYDLPQSVNLDFRTGIAEGTAIFGSVRWADWSETEINAPGYFANPIVSYSDDYVTYTLGVGRQLTDRLTGTAAVLYEPGVQEDGEISDLSPYDGQSALILAATYRVTEAFEVTGSVRYSRLGDAVTASGATFDDSDLVAVGARVAYRF